jgi:exodeoxyribonuclease V alpha subunit
MSVELEGTLETLTYRNEQTGYSVARLQVAGLPGQVTVVGTLHDPVVGQTLQLTGDWQNHPRFGRQFRIEASRSVSPATSEGIERYLGSGLVKGIGPELARRIVARFGTDSLRVIEEEPRLLSAVPGIGPSRLAALSEAWKAQRGLRDVMLFLQSHDIGTANAWRIYRQYGAETVERIRENPYRLAEEVYGIGFRTADRVAASLGLARDAPARCQAGLLFALGQAEGHTCLPQAELVRRAAVLLELPEEHLADSVRELASGGRVVVEAGAVYLPALHAAEAGIALLLHRLASAPRAALSSEPEKDITRAQARLDLTLDPPQAEALAAALREKVLVLTGGPGTGKTTILRALVAALSDRRVLLAAPTGRAAKRLEESSALPARTIHRLLEFDRRTGGFRKGPAEPLDCDLLIVDETSMVDTLLMYQLLRALPSTSGLLLVGDADQLPSVGAGNVLRDLISSGRVAVRELTHIYRQAAASRIVTNAHRIRAGQMPEGDGEDFYLIEQDSPQKAAEIILQLVTERIPRRFGLDPLEDIQVLSPMHKGEVGVENLNRLLQAALNPGATGVQRGPRRLCAGDKVLQLRNDYEKEVFNGDIGRIRSLDPESQEAEILFDGRPVRYELAELDEIALAYAVSVHKAQGGEFPAVVLPVMTQHYVLLQRNLLYTAVTRGRRLVVLVGTRRALHIALSKAGAQSRFTGLARRLKAQE